MSNQSDEPQPPAAPEVLVHLSQGTPADTSGLSVNPQPAAGSHRKAPPPADDDQLRRPRGALVAMRKSGGILFTWRLVVVHSDGRIIYKSNAIDAPAEARVVGRLDAAQLGELRTLIDQSEIARRSFGVGRQNPDAFAYELIARVGRKNASAEVFEGSIPSSLRPLIERLSQLIPAPAPAEPAPELPADDAE